VAGVQDHDAPFGLQTRHYWWSQSLHYAAAQALHYSMSLLHVEVPRNPPGTTDPGETFGF
jgi:hypothetical protein